MKMRTKILLACLLLFIYQQIFSQAQNNIEINYGNNSLTGNYLISNGAKIYYEIYGEGEPIILLHGNHGSIAYMHNQISFFSKYYKVIAVDNRNQGKSDKHDTVLTYKLLAYDILNLIDTLKLKKTNVLGWSDGANIGLELAKIAPEKISKLIMASGNYKIDTTVVDKSIIEELKYKVKTAGNEVDKSLFQLELEYPKLLEKDLQKIKIKILILSAENDIIKPAHSREMNHFLSNSKLFIIPGATHMLPLENPKLLNYLAINYLKSRNDSIVISGKVSSSENEKIEFVNIGIKGKSVGTTSNQDGIFKLIMPIFDFVNDSLYLSVIGYEPKSIPITDFIEGEFCNINLNEKSYEIREVIVKAGKLKTRTFGIKRAGRGIVKGRVRGTENAILVNSNHFPVMIKQLRFGTWSYKDTINYRVNFYNIKDSLPNEILIYKAFVFSAVSDENGWISNDLSQYNIYLDQDFFVAVEFLPNKNAENKNTHTFKAKMMTIGNPSYTRNYFDNWEKIPIGTALNITVQFSKN